MAVPFQGVKLQISSGVDYSTGTWVDYANVRALQSPTPEWDDDEVTTAASPDGAREYDPGLIEGGEAEITLMYDATTADTIFAQGGVRHGFRIVKAGSAGWKFNGYIKAFGTEGDLGSHFEMTVTIKVSGKPVHDATVLT